MRAKLPARAEVSYPVKKKTLPNLFVALALLLMLGLPASTALADQHEPTLFLSITSVYVSDLTSPSTVYTLVENTGSGTLNWTARTTEPWITLSPTGGSTRSETDQLAITLDPGTLTPGVPYVGTVIVSSNTGDETITLNVTRPADDAAVLSVGISTINAENLTGVATTSTVVRNSGSGTLTWNAFADSEWMSVSPVRGTTTTEIDQLLITIDPSTLVPGTPYYGAVTVTSDSGSHSITVQATGIDTTTLAETSPLTVGLTSITASDLVIPRVVVTSIRNTGAGTITWTISSDSAWISVDPTSGSTSSESDELTITLDPTTLTEDVPVFGTITISSSEGNRTISVSATRPGSVGRAQLVSPADGSEVLREGTETAVTLSWQRPDTATLVLLEVASDNDFATITLSETRSDTTAVVRLAAAENSLYYWRVRTFGDEGWGPWSEIRSFRVVTELGAAGGEATGAEATAGGATEGEAAEAGTGNVLLYVSIGGAVVIGGAAAFIFVRRRRTSD